ncbi:hypothetical protein QN277_015896 [Acacia crassicarpa]|uniref:Uncharacterized protein n=1 Tax=Acacia crassicarpa TaxID=499986 RepID=A0AAE1KMK3_9FABA|nr:hypothetical protein QN277_015896 [Acacia crassicarpa]
MERNTELRKGTWTHEEDNLLRACVDKYGEGRWHLVPQRAGLKRCRKSCRMRWLNYLKPNIKRGDFTEDEVDLIIRLHKLIGNRWALIAGRLLGGTSNDVKNFWHTKMRNIKKTQENHHHHHRIKEKEKQLQEELTAKVVKEGHVVIKPQPHAFSENSPWLRNNKNKLIATTSESGGGRGCANASISTSSGGSFVRPPCPPPAAADFSKGQLSDQEWWESLLKNDKGYDDQGQYGNSMMDCLDPDFLQMEGLPSWEESLLMKF